MSDSNPTQLKQLLQDIKTNEADYGFEQHVDRDRFIILFNNCRLPQTEIEEICQIMEPYIRVGDNGPDGSRGDNKDTSFGINVLIINQGADGFPQDPPTDDYILCLTEYDDERIYTNPFEINKHSLNKD